MDSLAKKNIFSTVNNFFNNAIRYYFIKLHDTELREYVGREATISFDLKIEPNGQERELLFYHYQHSGLGIKLDDTNNPHKKFRPSKEWQTFSFKGEIINKPIPATYNKGSMIIYDPTGDNTFSIRNIKVELDANEVNNMFLNAKFKNVKKAAQVTIDGQPLDITQPDKWITYNEGLKDAKTVYHSYVDSKKFNYPVVVFNESNGGRGWKALVQLLNGRLKEAGKYEFSVDLYAEGKGTKISGGCHYYLNGGTNQDFHTGLKAIFPTVQKKWKRYTTTINLHENADFSKNIHFYIYGHGFDANSILYLKDPVLEKVQE